MYACIVALSLTMGFSHACIKKSCLSWVQFPHEINNVVENPDFEQPVLFSYSLMMRA
jgi:hypothetical protein